MKRGQVTRFLAGEMGVETPVLPSTAITDGAGRVIKSMTGIPSVSDVRKVMGDL